MSTTKTTEIESKFKQLFPFVFSPIIRLPLEREVDHSINIILGSRPINLHPYLYSYFQKDEIEKLVLELLVARFIQPSQSLYVSPILLVKKRDGGWRFCVDYCALNKVTIPNKYLIPIVDELIDEL